MLGIHTRSLFPERIIPYDRNDPPQRLQARRRAALLSAKHISLKASNPACDEPVEHGDVAQSEGGRRVTEEEMRKRLAILRIEHRDLDAAIAALSAADSQDQLQLARLKKRKLRLKDQIAIIEDYLTPDIIA